MLYCLSHKPLREKYPHKNVIIEDFIAFEDVMPLPMFIYQTVVLERVLTISA